MFSGIIQTTGLVKRIRRTAAGRRLEIQGRLPGGALRRGESVGVDGVCLTVESVSRGGFRCTAVPETLRLTTLGRLGPGARVNLERALRYGEPVGGHLVQGHVDGLGRVLGWEGGRRERRLWLAAPARVRRDLVRKGSVAVNGISLTVAALRPRGFEVALIPHTLALTTLGGLRPGDPVNLEVDLFARYVRQTLAALRPRRPRRARRRTGARRVNR
jgi:riboflavin synthase alpha subunit